MSREEKGSGARGRRQKANSQQTRMCVGFEKVQSDDPLPPDSLCNTFTKAGEEGECQPSPPTHTPWSSDYTPLSPHSLGGRNEHSTVEGLSCSLPPLPLCNLQSLLLSPLDLGSRSWDAPVSSWFTTFCEERGLPPQFPRIPPSASGKITQAYARCNKNEIAGLTVSEEGMKLSSKGKLN